MVAILTHTIFKLDMSMVSTGKNVIRSSPSKTDEINRWTQRRQQYEQQLNLLSNIESVVDGNRNDQKNINTNANDTSTDKIATATLPTSTTVTKKNGIAFVATFSLAIFQP